MDQYTIYCTPEQTKKALELGAPIRVEEVHDVLDEYSLTLANTTHNVIHNPTAEQMLGWIEDNNVRVDITSTSFDNGDIIYGNLINDFVLDSTEYSSRQEATIAAIDAALEYLANNLIK